MQDTLDRSVRLSDDGFYRAQGDASTRVAAIEQSIAQTLSELDDSDDSKDAAFAFGEQPLDEGGPMLLNDGPQQPYPTQPGGHRRNRQPGDDPISRVIMAVMVLTMLAAIGLLAFAYFNGYVP